MTIWLKVMHCNWWDRYTRLHIIIVNHRLWVHYIISNATCSYNYCQILFTIITWLCVSVKHTVITFTYETLSLLAIVRCTQTNTNNLAKSILSSCLTAFSSGQTLLRKLIEISISRECRPSARMTLLKMYTSSHQCWVLSYDTCQADINGWDLSWAWP